MLDTGNSNTLAVYIEKKRERKMGNGVNKVGSGVTERMRITLFGRMGNLWF
jgi:hypothetical protein